MKLQYWFISLIFLCFFQKPSFSQNTSFEIDKKHQYYLSSALPNDNILVVTEKGILYPTKVNKKDLFRHTFTDFTLYNYSSNLKKKWEITLRCRMPHIIPAGGGNIIYVVDSITAGSISAKIPSSFRVRVLSGAGEVIREGHFQSDPFTTHPLVYLSEGPDLVFIQQEIYPGVAVDNVYLHRINFEKFTIGKIQFKLPTKRDPDYPSQYRFIGYNSGQYMFANRNKIKNIFEDNQQEFDLNFKVYTFNSNGELLYKKELKHTIKNGKYPKSAITYNQLSNRDLTDRAYLDRVPLITELSESKTFEQVVGFITEKTFVETNSSRLLLKPYNPNTSTFYMYHFDLRSTSINHEPKTWSWGNLWYYPNDNHFYLFGLTGPNYDRYGSKAKYTGYYLVKYSVEGVKEWENKSEFPKDFQKFGYFKSRATPGSREIDLFQNPKGELILSAISRDNPFHQEAIHIYFSPDGVEKKKAIASTQNKYLEGQALGTKRNYYVEKLYKKLRQSFHLINSEGVEFIVKYESTPSKISISRL